MYKEPLDKLENRLQETGKEDGLFARRFSELLDEINWYHVKRMP